MKMMTRGALAAFLLAAVVSGPMAQELTIVLGSEPTTLDPQLQEDGSERAINDNIYETLMVRSPSGELGLGLAASAPEQISDNIWRVVLRPGISFTNGEPLDAEAVAFSIKRIIDPAYNSAQMSFFSTLAGAEVVDAQTVDIHTSVVDPILPSRLYWLKILPPKHAQTANFAREPIGTGPYVIENWSAGSSISLARNENYWGDEPEIDQVEYRFVADSGTQMAGMLAGEFDLMTRVPPEFVDTLPVVKFVQGLEQQTIILDAVNGIAADERVRQALNYAIDKQAIAEALFLNYADVSQGQLLAPSYFGYDAETVAYPYDPEKARALLEEAGVIGQTISIEGPNDRWLKGGEVIEAVAGMWSAVGLNVDARIVPFSISSQHVFDKSYQVDAVFLSSSNELMDADRPLSAYYAMSGPGARNNDEKLNQMVIDARSEADQEARADLYAEAVRYAREEAYLAWLVVNQDIYGTSSRLVWEPRVDSKLLISEMAVTE